MPYATLPQVQAQIPKLTLTDASRPSVSDVTLYLQQRADEIDAALSFRGIATPVTAPVWFVGELSRLNARGAAADALLGAFISGEGNDRGPGPVMLAEYAKRVQQLRDGIGIPAQETDAARQFGPRSLWTDYPRAHEHEDREGRVFGGFRERW